MNKPLEINLTQFEDLVEQKPMLILDFWAEWCSPCKSFSPIFDQLAELNQDICFAKVNVDKESELAEAFQVRSIPTVIAFKAGEIIYESPGVPPAKVMEQIFSELRA
ncbi:MAG: thioredoxin [Oligoflexia bacterium]|nr:thioredoxin [Oligoflexia bacterium]